MTLEKFKEYIYMLGEKILLNKNSHLYPKFSKSESSYSEGGTVYISGLEYHYVIMERGKEIIHYKSENMNEVLYPVFKNIIVSMAQEYELKHRNEKEDFRRLLWRRQLELLMKVDTEFVTRRKKEIEEILKKYPFID